MPGLTFLTQLAFDHHLRGDTGVVRAWLPQGIVAFHPMVADQRVHDGVLEGVTHVQAAGYVRRWDHDAIGVTIALRGEVAFVFPVLIPGFFNRVRVVGFFHRSGGVNQRARL